MIISMRKRFAFLCMPKTGTTAIERALKKHGEIWCSGPPVLKHVNYAKFERHFLPFIRAHSEQFGLGDLDDFEVVTSFREPMEWRHSWYRYRARDRLAQGTAKERESYTGDLSFTEFLEEHFSEDPRPFAKLRSQVNFLRDGAGQVGRIRVFRYEDLDKLIAFLSARLGVPLNVPRLNVSPTAVNMAEVAEARARYGSLIADEYAFYDRLSSEAAVDGDPYGRKFYPS